MIKGIIAALAVATMGVAAVPAARVAVYDKTTVPQVEQLQTAAISHLLIVPGSDLPAATIHTLESVGISVVRAEPQRLRSGSSASGRPIERGELAVVGDGRWPRVRPTIALVNGRDTIYAGATSDPWLDSNGWAILYAQAKFPGRRVVLMYGPEASFRPRSGSLALAIAEAAAYGGSFAVPTTALVRPSDARGVADWKRTVEQLGFIAEHANWFTGPPETNVTVFAESLGPVQEVMNLQVRKNLPFTPLLRDSWPAWKPSVLVLIGQELNRVEMDRVAAWRSTGTAVVEQSRAPNPHDVAIDVGTHMGDKRIFRVTNAAQVLGNMVRTEDGKRVLHLLNYGIDPIQDVRIQLALVPKRAALFAPGAASPRELEVRSGEFGIPEMGAYCAVVLE